jgi:hypothetical protein
VTVRVVVAVVVRVVMRMGVIVTVTGRSVVLVPRRPLPRLSVSHSKAPSAARQWTRPPHRVIMCV